MEQARVRSKGNLQRCMKQIWRWSGKVATPCTSVYLSALSTNPLGDLPPLHLCFSLGVFCAQRLLLLEGLGRKMVLARRREKSWQDAALWPSGPCSANPTALQASTVQAISVK